MGEVYKARDTRLARTVAIKILTPDTSSDPERRVRFEREARAIAALDHPHICTLHDVGEHDGTHYLVMQHLEGETLASRLGRANGALLLDQALKIAPEVADALDKAHRAGITYRDLKPANIMLTKAGANPTDWSPDGQYIAFHSGASGTNTYDVLLLPRQEGAKPLPVAATMFTEMGGRFSPDGRFIAYASDESGRFEVYVQSFPTTGAKWQVSADGGVEPQWRQDGRELFYLGLDRKLFATTIIFTSPFDVAPARMLFQTGVPLTLTTPNRSTYTARGDGRSFLVNTDVPNQVSSVITVVMNWAVGLKK